MRQEVGQLLKKAIFDGVYEPGEQVYEAELAKKLQLSRGPIREALLQLERESLVRHVYNKGWFVLTLTPEEMSEITSLRTVLEVLTLRLAKERITDRELSRLKKIQRSMHEAYAQGQIAEAIQGDFDFHQEIWQISGHRLLQETLVKTTTPYFAFFKMSKIRSELELTAFQNGLQNHQAMIDFLAGDTSQSAEWCIRNHFAPVHVQNWSLLLDAIHKKEAPPNAVSPADQNPESA